MKERAYKKVIQSAFDQASAGYDKPAMRFFDNSAEYLVKSLALKGNEYVLDAATGTGKVALSLAGRLKEGRVVGVDLSKGMLALARKKASALKIKFASFKQGDVDYLGFKDASLDGITCGFAVHFWQDMPYSLAKLIQKIKPGGFFAMTSFVSGSFEPESKLVLSLFKKYGAKLPSSYSWERLDSVSKCEAVLKKTGLRNIRCQTRQTGYFLEKPEDWWDLVLHTGFRAFLNQLSAKQAACFKKDLLGRLAKQSKNKKIFLNVKVIFSTSRTPIAKYGGPEEGHK